MNLLFSVGYMNKALNNIISLMMLLTSGLMMGQTVDFSVVSVGEESGLDLQESHRTAMVSASLK